MHDRCKGKVRHRNQGAAIAAMKRIKNAGLVSYHCPDCGAWHLGNSRRPDKIIKRLNQLLARPPLNFGN